MSSRHARYARSTQVETLSDRHIMAQMGQVATQQPMDDLVDENDEAALLGELARIRAPAPSPTLPVPGNLCMRFMSEQFPYVAPVLLAVLAGTYTPAREAHIAFMEGGNKRARLCLARRTFGDLTDRQKGALDRLLRRWLFGDEDLDELAGRQRGTWGAEDDLSDVLVGSSWPHVQPFLIVPCRICLHRRHLSTLSLCTVRTSAASHLALMWYVHTTCK